MVFHDKVKITDITYPFVIPHFLSQLSYLSDQNRMFNITKAANLSKKAQTKEFGDKK